MNIRKILSRKAHGDSMVDDHMTVNGMKRKFKELGFKVSEESFHTINFKTLRLKDGAAGVVLLKRDIKTLDDGSVVLTAPKE